MVAALQVPSTNRSAPVSFSRMQQPSRPGGTRPASRHRRAARMRALAGLLLLLAFATTTWQSALGSQCQRRLAEAQLVLDGAGTPVVGTVHGHVPAGDAGTPAPGLACPVFVSALRASHASFSAGSHATPRPAVARLVSSADPPALFRPPRLT